MNKQWFTCALLLVGCVLSTTHAAAAATATANTKKKKIGMIPDAIRAQVEVIIHKKTAEEVSAKNFHKKMEQVLEVKTLAQEKEEKEEKAKEKREGQLFQECLSSSSSRSHPMLPGSVGAHYHPQQQQLRQRRPVTAGTVDSRQQQQQQQQQYHQFQQVVVPHNEQQQSQQQQQQQQHQQQQQQLVYIVSNDDDAVPLTVLEQEGLTGMMNNLAPEQFHGVIHIMREAKAATRTGDDDDDDDEIDVDLDQFDTATQRKLLRYVTKFYKPTGTTASPSTSTTRVPGTTSTDHSRRPVIGSL
eukprot:CAMPEP_0170940156 /NCGR_PEP_ID=MMETSP0735-20130129/22493_1 /TAXON_ID=186038 /ORGANISM="Fragilariopsis kerguelensis, Strain L26-C5" /LENGTH=299 /DNA_ID=CAMNT_0011345937 /DNA_START=1 /DNA_END=896 /DNA_ORIENTATION=+